MDGYEETGTWIFSGYAHTGAVLDRFSFTGPFSAGLTPLPLPA